jgi:hypothetical protein
MNNGDKPINPVHFKTDDSGFEFSPYRLTKREYFAAMAMQGYIAHGAKDFIGTDSDQIAKISLMQADALLKALEK